MKFKKEELKYIIWDDSDLFKLIEDKIIDQSRWTIRHYMVFQDKETKKYYSTSYSVGATEMQDERPFEYEPDEIECKEVFAHQVVKTVYKNTPPSPYTK